MRRALNDNPLLQAGLVCVLLLGVGLLLLMRMGGSDDSATETPAPTEAAAVAPAADATAATAVPPADVSSVPGAAATGEFKAGPGLPKDVVAAYDDGKAVVLLIVNQRGIDDRDLKRMVKELRSRPDTAVFVTSVRDVARYSRITQGVDVDRTPALVIMRPKRFTEGSTPTAFVSYGFRGIASVNQALRNAFYDGRSDLPYYPR